MGIEDSSGIEKLISAILQKSNLALGIETAIVTSTASIIIGIFAYFVKRYFALKDFKNQQQIQHSTWLLQQLHDYASNHYVVLTRHIINAEESLREAVSTKNKSLIENSYKDIAELVKTYFDFQEKTGANILFMDRNQEDNAIGKLQSLFLSLPFDYKDYLDIREDKYYRPAKSFERWTNSTNCNKSVDLVKKRLKELSKIFDTETERILHYDYFLKYGKPNLLKKINNVVSTKIKKRFCENEKRNSIVKNEKEKTLSERLKIKLCEKKNSFFIHKIIPKYVKGGQTAIIIGYGFSNEKNKEYALYLNGTKINDSFISETATRIEIPEGLQAGTYEITAMHSKDPENMGIVIHIN